MSHAVVDRIDLDTQISATLNAADVPNMVGVATRKELQDLLGQDVRKVLITTIHKFAEAGGVVARIRTWRTDALHPSVMKCFPYYERISGVRLPACG
jgi:hypothetical protein